MFSRRRVYLDRAAGASGNPTSPHTEGQRAKEKLEASRRSIAGLLEVQADDVLFTSGATEANAIAIVGSVHAAALTTGGKLPLRALYHPGAHASIVENAKRLTEYGAEALPLPLREGRIDIPALLPLLIEGTVVVTMEAVCGETGIIGNTREVAAALKKAGKGTLLHVDASQAPLTEKLARSHFGADLLTLDGSKVGTARGIGCLVAHRTTRLMPLYGGGGQERGLRSGSESPELAEQFAKDLRQAASEREHFRAAAEHMRARFIETIGKDSRLADVSINEGRVQTPHIINMSLRGRDTDYIVALLDEAGFAVSTRSACETDSEEGSRAVFALTGDPERASATLRLSFGPGVSSADMLRFADALGEAVAFVDSRSSR